jgi:hypothetical protein
VKKNWKMFVVVAAVAVIGLSVVAVASGAAKVKNPFRGRAACGQLMDNPKAVAAMQALRDEHRQEMQAWSDKYGTDPTGAEAQAALTKLRQAHWNDMKSLFKQFGVTVPKGAGPGVCGGQGGMMGGGGMMGSGGSGPCGGGSGAGCASPGSATGNQGSGYGGGMMGNGGMMGGASY